MTTMIERVAETMCVVANEDDNEAGARDWNSNQGVYREMARAAIEAMQEPTPEMVEAGWAAAMAEDAAETWRNMIDAALKEERHAHHEGS